MVYLTVMLADWLQGTNMYTLYQSYGVDVGTLFLTGFSSAAVFGTFLGLFVDRFGRRNGCIVFCLLEVGGMGDRCSPLGRDDEVGAAAVKEGPASETAGHVFTITPRACMWVTCVLIVLIVYSAEPDTLL